MVTEAPGPGQPDKFQPLRDAYRAALPGRIAEICDQWASLERGAALAPEPREFQRRVHTIAGSAGTFGLPAVGDCARELEDFLNASEDGPAEQRQVGIERRLARLRALALVQE